ncbi:hypothetical protein C8T65DRAFT_727857 [Cerioporus squamosus]|nr:hypothetical protein C8T65DRAFT_727857 [Cerioporus squamosus]
MALGGSPTITGLSVSRSGNRVVTDGTSQARYTNIPPGDTDGDFPPAASNCQMSSAYPGTQGTPASHHPAVTWITSELRQTHFSPGPSPRSARGNLTTVANGIKYNALSLFLYSGKVKRPVPCRQIPPPSLTMAFAPVTAGVAPGLPDASFSAAFAPVTAGAAPALPDTTFAAAFTPLPAGAGAGTPSQSLTMASFTSVAGAAAALPTRAGIQVNPVSPDILFPHSHGLDNTYGAYLIGTFFGILLFGYSLHQLSAYFRRFPSDTTLIRLSVITVMVLETVYTAFTIHTSYYYLVSNHFDDVALFQGVWSLNTTPAFMAATMFTSQLFFARRVSLMGRRYQFIAGFAMLFFTAEVSLSAVSVFQAYITPSFWLISDVNVVLAALFGSAVAGDTLLTTSLIVELQRSRLSEARRKESRLDTALLYIVNTGLLHDVLNVVAFILALTLRKDLIHSSIAIVTTRVYANTLLAVLNSRKLPASIEVVGGVFGINTIQRARRLAKQEQWNTPHVLESSLGAINVAIATEEISDKLAAEKLEEEKWRDDDSTLDSVDALLRPLCAHCGAAPCSWILQFTQYLPATLHVVQQAPSGIRPSRRPSEYPAVTRVLTRAFAKDPAMNWYGGVTELVEDIDSPTPKARRSMRNLSLFQEALVRATVLVNGVVTVVVIPRTDDKDEARASTRKRKDSSKEEIVAVCLWLPPGKTLDMGPITVLRSGVLNVLRGWGFRGVKRVLFEFSPTVEHSLKKSFKARGLDRRDSWHLLQVVVDPNHQKKGFSSMLMEEGFRRASPKPIHLEATTAASRDIYARYNFEIDEEHRFGVGQVDKNGIKAKGEAATGFPEWIMTKVVFPSREGAQKV